jgi:Glycosyl hydrolases family 35
VILRVGPFCHGECRNGGLPDGLYGRPFEVRSNAERYLAYVRRQYGEIGRQVRGQFFQDGGPVIGVQLENEFMAAAAPWEMVPKQAHEWITEGCNLIGYYMYHGGLNPVGRHAFMNEHVVPKISYDFQAPLGEFGQVKPSYKYLKLVHLFASTFGAELCRMGTVLPEGSAEGSAPITPEDVESLRWAVRVRDGAGFVFLNNTQDHVVMHDQAGLQFVLELDDETLTFPRAGGLTLKKDTCVILPFNLMLSGVSLHYATLQPVTKLETREGIAYFFFAPDGMPAEYGFDCRMLSGLSVSDETVVKKRGPGCRDRPAGQEQPGNADNSGGEDHPGLHPDPPGDFIVVEGRCVGPGASYPLRGGFADRGRLPAPIGVYRNGDFLQPVSGCAG